MRYNDKARYQFQPWYIKALRQCRWTPYLWWRRLKVAAWFANPLNWKKLDEFHRDGFGVWGTFVICLGCERGAHDIRVGHYWHGRECIDRIRRKLTARPIGEAEGGEA